MVNRLKKATKRALQVDVQLECVRKKICIDIVHNKIGITTNGADCGK